MGVTQTQSKKLPEDHAYDLEEDDEYYVTRPHTSARRYSQPPQRDTLDDDAIIKGASIQQRRSLVKPHRGGGLLPGSVASSWRQGWRHSRRFTLIAVIVGMLVMAVLILAISALGSWWRIRQDDMTYGRPRTFQMDAVVGHSDSASNPSHFIFLNLNRHVEIIEMPGGDATHARIYNGPTLFGDGQDLTPVTAEFRDVNGDGKLDMIVHIQDQRLVFINDGTQFRPLQQGEKVNL
jgi:hypothetical protein